MSTEPKPIPSPSHRAEFDDEDDFCESCGEYFDVCLCCPYCGAGIDEDCDTMCPRPLVHR